jgi:hypothetical protein
MVHGRLWVLPPFHSFPYTFLYSALSIASSHLLTLQFIYLFALNPTNPLTIGARSPFPCPLFSTFPPFLNQDVAWLLLKVMRLSKPISSMAVFSNLQIVNYLINFLYWGPISEFYWGPIDFVRAFIYLI